MDENENQSQDVQPEKITQENSDWKNRFPSLIKIIRYLAIVLFVVALFVGFWLGMEFQKKSLGIEKMQVKDTIETDIDKEDVEVTYGEKIPADWNLYQNDEFGFAFRYPKEWELSVKDRREGKPDSVLEINVVDPLEHNNRFIVRYKQNELNRIVLKWSDKTYNIQLIGGIVGTVYEGKGMTPPDSVEEYDVFVVRYEGDLLELSPARKFDELYKNIASTISFTSNKKLNSLVYIGITKADLIPYFNDLYECSSAKDEWQCFDENLNIAERQSGKDSNVYDVIEYKEGRVFTSFSDITGDGYDDATVMIYYKRFSVDTFYMQSVFVLTRDVSITGDPERDIFKLFLSWVGNSGQSVSGFKEIFPLEAWVDGVLNIGSPNYRPPTINLRPCNQLVWDDKGKMMRLLQIECNKD